MQTGLDIVGMTEIPIVSQVADLSSGAISFYQGDYLGAGTALFAAIPIVGSLASTFKVGKYVVGKHKQVKKLSKGTKRQSHHIIQDAAARNLPNYKYGDAPAISLFGGSKIKGSPHDLANRVQRKSRPGTGVYASERRIGYRALREAGLSVKDAKAVIRHADTYFMDQLGATLQTVMRTPGR